MKSARVWGAGVLVVGLGGGMVPAQAGAQTADPRDESLSAQATTCNLNVDNWNVTSSDRTYHAPFYESTLTIRVRVDPATCAWRIDNSQKPGWLNLSVTGNYIGNGYFQGPAVVDVRFAKNSGYGRSGRVRFVTSSYSLPVDFGQAHYTGSCQFKPEGTVAGQWKVIAPGFLAVTQSMAMPANNFLATIVDKSTCPLSPRAHAYTFGMTGATIQRMATPPRSYVIHRSGVQRNTTGEGALFVMNQPGYAAFSGVLAQDPGANRHGLEACKAGNPDSGTLVITALPNGPNARVGAIFTAWGNVIFVVQRAS